MLPERVHCACFAFSRRKRSYGWLFSLTRFSLGVSLERLTYERLTCERLNCVRLSQEVDGFPELAAAVFAAFRRPRCSVRPPIHGIPESPVFFPQSMSYYRDHLGSARDCCDRDDGFGGGSARSNRGRLAHADRSLFSGCEINENLPFCDTLRLDLVHCGNELLGRRPAGFAGPPQG